MARTLIASDTFTEAAGTPNLEAHGAGPDWTALAYGGGYIVVDSATDKVKAAFSIENEAFRWAGSGTFAETGQYAKATIGGLAFTNNSNRAGVIVRASADTGANRDYYAVLVYDDAASGGSHTTDLVRCANGTHTVLASATYTWSNGDTIALEVEGTGTSTVLRMYRNDVQFGSDYTDSGGSALGYTSTKPGLIGNYSSPPSWTLDDWEGGDVGGGTPVYAPPTLRRSGPSNVLLTRF
jgi:hypothetical protein